MVSIKEAREQVERIEEQDMMKDWSSKKKEMYRRLGSKEFDRQMDMVNEWWNSPDGKKAIKESIHPDNVMLD